MKRRNFITLLGGAVAWPLAAGAQQGERVRRVGVVMNLAADDAEGEARLAAFLQGLQQLGWSDGRNVRIDYRWAAGDAGRFHRYAWRSCRTSFWPRPPVPIVFAIVADPVGARFVDSLARPGGNVTGFTPFEYGMSGRPNCGSAETPTAIPPPPPAAPGGLHRTRFANRKRKPRTENQSRFPFFLQLKPSHQTCCGRGRCS